jgi:hypothetical protein
MQLGEGHFGFELLYTESSQPNTLIAKGSGKEDAEY